MVGELWQERSQKIGPSRSATRLPDDGAPSMELHTSPQLEYDSTEHRNITRPEDVQLDQNTPCTGVASPSQAANPLDNELQDLWLQRYHPWFPILHHTSMRAAFSGTVPDRSLVRKAITAVTIWDIPGLSTDYKLAQSGSLSQEVVLKAMGSSNFDSLQGLLILAMLAWGEGKWSQCGNLIALCKRYGALKFHFTPMLLSSLLFLFAQTIYEVNGRLQNVSTAGYFQHCWCEQI